MAQSSSAKDIAAREAEITGKPPRILPLKADEFGKDADETLSALRKALSLPPTATVPEFNATMLRHPDLYRAHSALGLSLFDGALSPRDRELAVLRTGWLCKAPFQWSAHTRIAKNLGGLTTEEIERATEGSTAPGWSAHDRAILRAVEELIQDAMISDETWAILERELDQKQLLELPILVGQYQGVAYLQNAIRVRLMPGYGGLSDR